jgi:cytochrome c peroxidase
VQSREPSQLQLEDGTIIPLGGATRKDTGLALFHMNSGGGIACASCHPEGRDDGRTWEFQPIGPRRTQVPSGGIMATAPFHWTGDMDDFDMLVHEVFSSRMGGGLPDDAQLRSFSHWLNGQPFPKAALAVDEAAAERGRTIFERPDVACASCHTGPLLTNNTTHDVGTGDYFQVPSLVGISGRPPFMHDGCAATLKDRFRADCGGAEHGSTAQLSAAEIDDLVAYLETL